MGQGQSKERAVAESTDNLSVEKEIKYLRQLAEKEGFIAMSNYINMTLNRWKTEQVKIAITGRSATGKSTAYTSIEEITNLHQNVQSFLARIKYVAIEQEIYCFHTQIQ
jgi:GTP-binding protein EngB required for normal cell division